MQECFEFGDPAFQGFDPIHESIMSIFKPDRWPKWLVSDGVGAVRGVVYGTACKSLALLAAERMADGFYRPSIEPCTTKDLVLWVGLDRLGGLDQIIWAEYIAPEANAPRKARLQPVRKANGAA